MHLVERLLNPQVTSSVGEAAPPKSGRKSEAAINEGILKVMADLKIDTNITREVSQSYSWNERSTLSKEPSKLSVQLQLTLNVTLPCRL